MDDENLNNQNNLNSEVNEEEKVNIEENEKNEQTAKKIEKIKIWICIGIIVAIILFMVLIIIQNSARTIRGGVLKPVIYLYPEEEQIVEVELGKKENLTCTYPLYDNPWKVKAKTNGDLIDLETGRELYCLYWEGEKTLNKGIEEGFCIKGSDSAKFLEEKLQILGLTQREANEFIIYWLPKLEKNEYNLINFETIEEINEDMPLKVTPKPDTVIRIRMKFKKVNEYVEIKEQELETPNREGFTVVEWGGTELSQ